MENQENTNINERKVCEKCGQKNSIDNKFCLYCGEAFNLENILTEETENKKNIFIIVMGIIALLPFILNPIGVILLIIYLLFPNTKKAYYSILEVIGSIASGGLIILLILFGTCLLFAGFGAWYLTIYQIYLVW